MILRYLLDTNVLSEPVRPTPSPALMDRLRIHRAAVATAAPVWHELVFGCSRLAPSARRRKLERYLYATLRPALPILSYDDAAAAWHASERARLTSAGCTPSFVDGQIAAVARTRDLILVTANAADYEDYEGLVVESWLD